MSNQPSPVQTQEQQQQREISTEEAFVRLAMESQRNLTKLIHMQEQQMNYINTVFNTIVDERQRQQEQVNQFINNGAQSQKDQTVLPKTGPNKSKV